MALTTQTEAQTSLAGVLLLGVSLVAAAYVLGHQIATFRLSDSTITVRGAAELAVQADVATWSLGLNSAADTLAVAQQNMAASMKGLQTYLVEQGIPAADIEPQTVSVADALTNQYAQGRGARFAITGGLTVRTGKLDAVQKAKLNLAELLTRNVALASSNGPNYSYTKLNDDKPKLVGEATQAARASAEQFAADAGVRLGDIKSARQGSVEILGRDTFTSEAEQVGKVLRVVTTIDYLIK
ncbi:MAG TPA: SIMPL domain-containing protein [Alphaproteobacteria bacterium]|nr:SIMPL domain-containing protein [Alphaproteobacteria bacterium]